MWSSQHTLSRCPACLWSGVKWILLIGKSGWMFPRGEWLYRYKWERSGESLGRVEMVSDNSQGWGDFTRRYG